MSSMTEEYAELCKRVKKISHLEGTMGLLGWDEQTMMPSGAEEARANQKAVLAGVLHEAKVDPVIGNLLSSLEKKQELLDDFQKANIRECKTRYERNTRMSAELASREAHLESTCYAAWVKARENSDFASFAPMLKEMFDLRKEILTLTKPEMSIYDAAIDSFDPRMKMERLEVIFGEVKRELTPMIEAIKQKAAADPSLQQVHPALQGGADWDTGKQAEMCKEIAKAIGFDFQSGRMDVSVHPFTGGSHSTDVRITTRYSEGNWIEGVAGTIHECGHAMYEQGRNKEMSDLPVSEALGMATHESQSLLWERMVGQSLSFWKWATPIMHRYFPHTKECTAEDFYKAVNIVQPSLIRVDADEVTYPLHVILRFEIERDLMQGKLDVSDLARVWNDKMKSYLGVAPPSDREGVLQDVHWSSGAIGYFPSYSLGAMMATQLFRQAKKEISNLEEKIEKGNFLELKQWLNKKVHEKGSLYPNADKLLEAVTGEPLQPSYFIEYLKEKYQPLYKF